MTAAISTFERDYRELLEFVKRSFGIDKLFARLPRTKYTKAELTDTEQKIVEEYLDKRANQKIFIYKSFIIVLYGLLERYIEEAIKEYVTACCRICSDYDKLPDKLKEVHKDLAIELVGKLSYSKFSHIKIEQVVNILNQGLNNNIAVVIPESFLQNGGNYKHDVICRMLNNLDIDVKTLLHKYNPLASNLDSKYKDEHHYNLFYENCINRIVTERNTIAHGGQQAVNLPDEEEMLSMAADMRDYVLSINHILVDFKLKLMYDLNTSATFKSNELYRAGTVIIPQLEGMSVSIGHKIIAKRAEHVYPQYNVYTVKNLQINDQNVSFVSCNSSREVGIELDSYTNKNCTYKFLEFHPPLYLLA